MMGYSLITFVILLEILQNAYSVSGNDSLKREIKKSDLLGNHQSPSDEKMFDKRGFHFKDGEINSGAVGREFENNEFSLRRRINYTVTETESEYPEYQKQFNNWEKTQNNFQYSESGNSRNHHSMPTMPAMPTIGQSNSNQKYNWGQRGDIFGTGKLNWNEEKFKQLESEDETFNKYNERIPDREMIGNFQDKNDDILNRRYSLTTLNDEGRLSSKHQNDEAGLYEFVTRPGRNYYNRHATGYYNPSLYKPEKGVIINFNTDCPRAGQLNNPLLPKYILAPKSAIPTVPGIPHFHVPGSTFFSTPRRTPLYF